MKVLGQAIAGNCVAGWIVKGPVPGAIAKVIEVEDAGHDPPPLAILMASLREPAPLSLVLVTTVGATEVSVVETELLLVPVLAVKGTPPGYPVVYVPGADVVTSM